MHVCIPLLCVHGHVFVWVGVGRLECRLLERQAAGNGASLQGSALADHYSDYSLAAAFSSFDSFL